MCRTPMLAAAWAAEPPKERILTISERLDRYMANHCCMIEVSRGTATLCSVARQYGLDGSIALDKTKKRGAKQPFLSLTFLIPRTRNSCITGLNQICWLGHTMPQFAARVQEHGRFGTGDPDLLRSDEFPMGLPDLTPGECQRVDLANSMYIESCAFVSILCIPWNLGDHGEPHH